MIFLHSSDNTVCMEVVALVVSSFLMSEDNICKGLTKSLCRKDNEHNYWITSS